MQILFQNGPPADKPLEKLEFLGAYRAEFKLIDKKMEKVDEHGHMWLDYHFTGRDSKHTEPVRLFFRVDATTKLPNIFRIETSLDGKAITRETRFEYPADGPADVYALGIPKTVELVDRTPSEETKRILEALETGRRRMENYRAVVEDRSTQQQDNGWETQFPRVVYRKGNKFCTVMAHWSGDYPMPKKPASDENMSAWWQARLKQFQFWPWAIHNGPTLYNINVQGVTGADGVEYPEVKSVHKTDMVNLRITSWSYFEWSPELICRPDLPIPIQDMEPVLDKNPQEGPPDTILLRVRCIDHIDPERTLDGREITIPDAYRYWLDPAKDYVVVRFDMLSGDEPGKEEIISSKEIEDFARSPGGVWYATRYRSRNKATSEADEKQLHGDKYLEWEHYFYVDFDVNIPDAMFEPHMPGERIRFFP